MTWETLPNRSRRIERPEPRLSLYDARHGYLNVSALEALGNGTRCAWVLFERDDQGRIAILANDGEHQDAFAVTPKGAVNVARLTELLPPPQYPVSVRLVQLGGDRRLFLAGRL